MLTRRPRAPTPGGERAPGARGPSPAAGGAAIPVLYRDRWIIAVCKPAGLPTQGSAREPGRSLVAEVDALLRRQGAFDGRARLHHRLDADTSGVVLLSLHDRADPGLAAAFRERQAQKTYWAVTDPRPAAEDEWLVAEALREVADGPGRRRAEVHADGRPAETSFRVLARGDDAWLVEASPRTGRMHQIRAHLSHAGAPIAGDRLYGGARVLAGATVPRLMLHAARLVLRHPVTGEPLELAAPPPPDLAAELKRLGLDQQAAATTAGEPQPAL